MPAKQEFMWPTVADKCHIRHWPGSMRFLKTIKSAYYYYYYILYQHVWQNRWTFAQSLCREALLWGFEACLLISFQLESGTSRIDPQLSQSCKVLLAASSLHKAAMLEQAAWNSMKKVCTVRSEWNQIIRIAICWFQLSELPDVVVLWVLDPLQLNRLSWLIMVHHCY